MSCMFCEITVPITSRGMEMRPGTPVIDRESRPITTSSCGCGTTDLRSSFMTPEGKTFNSFLPGPSPMIFAPKKKSARKTFYPVQRKLDFDAADSNSPLEKEASADAQTSGTPRSGISESCSSIDSMEIPKGFQTPGECSFDAFEPREEPMMTPKKRIGGTPLSVQRLLDFDDQSKPLAEVTSKEEEEERAFLAAWSTLIIRIVTSSQLEGGAEISPDAVFRKFFQSRNPSPEICRQLQF